MPTSVPPPFLNWQSDSERRGRAGEAGAENERVREGGDTGHTVTVSLGFVVMIHSDAWAEGVGQEFQAQGVQECVCVCVCVMCVCVVCVYSIYVPLTYFSSSLLCSSNT